VYGNGSENYSIIGWADSIKRSASGFEYMLEAGSRGANGGIWTANEAYSFSGEVDSVAYISQGSSYFGSDVVAGSTGFRQNVTLTTKFGTWEYANDGLERRSLGLTTAILAYQALLQPHTMMLAVGGGQLWVDKTAISRLRPIFNKHKTHR
jgi:hypothetical protein